MKRWFLITISTILAFSIFSCSNEEDTYTLNKVRISLGIIETENNFGHSYMILCDNGDTLLPANTNTPDFLPQDSSRVVVNYTLLDDVNSSQQLYSVSINNINNVLFKDLVKRNNNNTDSLGNAPIIIENIWRVNNMLNIDFKVWGSYKTHYINLAYDSLITSENENPIKLKFLHNNNNDDENFLLNGLVTFKLNKLKTEENDSVYFTVESTDYNGQNHTFNGMYYY